MKEISKDSFHRFAIAYGLSIPDYEAPVVTGFPTQFPDAPPPRSLPCPVRDTGHYPDDNSSM
ncbi:hypothetical protein PCC8801_4553 (plasmid) [Rippkaea orientalis PCC 8801]|uniref:Uncharacterized protein n=2 Tax=Rippkaea TaxID=2546365 RepID=B7K6N9_RIPO1|nr:hypothetical protein PCC8801_4553 [Rippkaea orientalis PCC 8801]